MNTYHLRTAAVALALAGAASAFGQPNRPTPLPDQLSLAPFDSEDRSLRRFAGQKLFNNEGADLGTLKDFIVHLPSGRLRYGVVSSGGVLGMGNSLRLVPADVLRYGDDRRFTVNIKHAGFLAIPPVRDEDYVVDRFVFTSAQHQQMVQAFGGTGPTVTTSPGDTTTGLVRATTLRGKPLHADDRLVGNIENILLDVTQGRAAALVDANTEFVGSSAKFLVPLGKLSFDAKDPNRVTTLLSRPEFERAAPNAPLAVRTNPDVNRRPATAMIPIREENSLPPTGRPSSVGAPNPAPRDIADDTLQSAARAVRQAIRSDTKLADENIQISTEEGKVFLRGSTRTQALKSQIESTAKRIAPRGWVESRIVVE